MAETNNTTLTTLTPYQVAKLTNEMLRARGLKEIPPQMCYNYVRKGLIPSVNGHITVEAAEEWAERYVAKKFAAAGKIG